jgi:hypothetical protein
MNKKKSKARKLNRKQREAMTLPEIEAHAQEHEPRTKPHYHKDENGFLVQCYHVCHKGLRGVKETLMSPAFWVATTLTWPIEHFIYDHIPPFSWIGHLIRH